MSTVGKYNGVSAYDVKHNGVNDIKSMNGVYAPSVFDTSNATLYLDPLDTNTYTGSGTTLSSSLGTTNTGTFQGGMEGGLTQGGWFNTDAVNDFAFLPSYQLGTQWTAIHWSYAERGSQVNVYVNSYTSGINNGIRMDIGSNSTASWARWVFPHNSGTQLGFTNSQPQGYWYMQYAIMNSGVSTRYGCSEVAGTFDHRTTTTLNVTAGTTPPVSNVNSWGNGVQYGFYEVGKVGQFWVFNRAMNTAEIERIYENTKSRYGY